MPRAVLLSTLVLLLAACSATDTPPPVQSLTSQCSLPRPQVCTMEYDPVCAAVAGGTQREYSSPCNACAHDLVISYVKGACPTSE